MVSFLKFSLHVSLYFALIERTSSWVFHRPLNLHRFLAHRLFYRCHGRLYSTSAPIITSSSDSSFLAHVMIQESGVSLPNAITTSVGNLLQSEEGEEAGKDEAIMIPTKVRRLNAHQLLLLGSIWHMSAAEVEHNNNVPADKPLSLRYKPQRLSLENRTLVMQTGDYLRIHHTPRRFTAVYDQDWSSHGSMGFNNITHKIIVHEGDGFWVIDKPPLVPVHATVDNCVENSVSQLRFHNPDQDYVTATQRLDINTSGLLVVANKPEFASYFAKILRQKTKEIKEQQSDTPANASKVTNSSALKNDETNINIQKGYKCLVCVPGRTKDQDLLSFSSSSPSAIHAWQDLKALENTIVRHFLEPSVRAPKRFELVPPPTTSDAAEESNCKKWLECLLKIRSVSPLVPIPTPECPLAQALWEQSAAKIPPNTKALCEVDIQLLTGRSHQIRGQLSKLGFPIVGDEQYGGAIPTPCDDGGKSDAAQLLALQCCQLEFRDADYEQVWSRKRRKDITQGFPSDRWIRASLKEAWWTPHLKEQELETTSSLDLELLKEQQQLIDDSSLEGIENEHVDLLPPAVQEQAHFD